MLGTVIPLPTHAIIRRAISHQLKATKFGVLVCVCVVCYYVKLVHTCRQTATVIHSWQTREALGSGGAGAGTRRCSLNYIIFYAHAQITARRLQLLLKEISRRTYDGFSCRSCSNNLNDNPSWLHHICSHHPEAVDNLPCEEIISALKEGNIYVLSTGAISKLSSILSGA